MREDDRGLGPLGQTIGSLKGWNKELGIYPESKREILVVISGKGMVNSDQEEGVSYNLGSNG